MAQQPLIKPNQIDGLPFIDAAQKQQYKNGLTQLWNILESSAQGSPQYQEAELKIRKASMNLMQKLGQSQRARPGSGGAPASRPTQAQGNAAPGQVAQQGSMTQSQALSQPQSVQATQGGVQSQAQQTPQQQAQQQQAIARAQQDLKDVVIYPPPNMSGPNVEQYKTNTRRSWLNCLVARETLLQTGRKLQAQIQNLTAASQPVSQQLQSSFQDVKNKVENNSKQLSALKARNAEYANAAGMNNATGGQQLNVTPRPGVQQTPNAASPQQADSKSIGIEQPSTDSPAQPQGGFPPQPQPGQNQQGATAQPTQAPTPVQPQQQTPQSATQPQPSRNFPSSNMAHTPNQQPQRPSINAQQAQAHMAQHQAQGTPTSALPQNVRPGQQPDHPSLTHQAAISQAASEYARTQAQQGPQQGQAPQPMPNGMPYNQQHPGARQNTPSSAYPNLQTTQTSSANTKFPIPKTLQLDPRTQNAVPGPPSRPTLTNQGMMTHPGVQRPPTYTLEGEGDRVLSKRKLDELVRQVTGSAPDTSGESASVLAPDVEESMMQVADDFVDNVITAACRLAKLRPTQTLDIRDIQIVLERNYGIRIPGYSLDEVRTVRKFQPAPGWHSKMQAVQAGKVMSNRDS